MYFEGLPSIAFTLVDHTGFLALEIETHAKYTKNNHGVQMVY